MAPRWVWNCLPGSRTTVCSRPFGSVNCTRSPTAKAPGTVSCSVSTGEQPTEGADVTLVPCCGADARKLSVVRPSLGPMTAMVHTGQPAEGAASSPDAPVEDGTAPRRPSLSPSRAADFKTCPLLYRFRTID